MPSRPHVVLVTIDTLRADHLSVNGYGRATSPHIDAFAARAHHFTQMTSVIPKTCPSFVSFFTGLYPEEHGVKHNPVPVPASARLMAEQFQGLGYRTAAFVGNPALRRRLGFERGFDLYEVHQGNDRTESVEAAFLSWASTDWDRPSFVWVHFLDPHGPYEPAPELVAPFLADELAQDRETVSRDFAAHKRKGFSTAKILGAIPEYQQVDDEDRRAVYVARYDAELRAVDAAFGRVVSFLERRELFEQCVVIFASDHGESLGEHDFHFEHGWFAFEPTLHVPLMIKTPGQSQGSVIDALVSNVDLLPTLAALIPGLDPGRGAGRDVLAPLTGPAFVLIENADSYPVKYFGLRGERWKYLVREDNRAEELYDLRIDPSERRNLVGSQAPVLARLRRRLRDTLARARAQALRRAAPLAPDAETLRRLKELGYGE